MTTQDVSMSSQSTIRNDEDIFNILVATDIHLGYAEDDPVRGQDTFDSFEEILQIASAEEVDFILLGGDLFHYAQPSPYCIHRCLELLKKYCLGERPVSVEFLSDPSQNFSQSLNPTVNYEDPNLNISLPVFSIHGNHDDPTGKKHISALDLLSTSGLVNYFGRWNNFDQVEISPILLQKGKSKLALYGLSHIRDERLGRLFLNQKVKMLSPENKEDWFHLLVWHQNRATRGTKNFIPDNCLPNFLDLVIWGHEHDCRIEAERKNDVFISQPGSSVATSLTQGESIPKKVGIFKICQREFKLQTYELKTVRPFKYAEIILKDEMQMDDESSSSFSEQTKRLVNRKIDSLIREAKSMGHEKRVSEKPLIRVIIKYQHERNVFNTIRFGQSYMDKVANPDNMVKFQLTKEYTQKKKVQDVDEAEPQGPVLADRVEDLVSQHFTDNETLSFFPLNTINESVKRFIDSNDGNAVTDVIEKLIKEMLKNLEKDMPDIEDTITAIANIKNNMDANSVNFVNRILEDPGRQNKKATNDNGDIVEIIDDDDDDYDAGRSKNKKLPLPAKGRGATRARRGRGPSSSSRVYDDEENIEDDSSGEERLGIFAENKRKARGRGGTSRGRGTKGTRGGAKRN